MQIFILRNIFGSSVCVCVLLQSNLLKCRCPSTKIARLSKDRCHFSKCVCVCWEWLFMQKVSNKLGDQFHQKVRFLILENCPQMVSISFSIFSLMKYWCCWNLTVFYKHKWFSISPIFVDWVSGLAEAPKSKNKQHLVP